MALAGLAGRLCALLQTGVGREISAHEWRIIGQEQDSSQLFSWISTVEDKQISNVGIYTNKTKSLKILYTFPERLNIIQASVNASHSALGYVVKLNTDDTELYCPYLVLLQSSKQDEPIVVQDGSTKQTMVQYVYGKSNKYSPGVHNDRFILFTHLHCIKIFKTTLESVESEEDVRNEWNLSDDEAGFPTPDVIVNVFSWAQWDCVNQVLYYIHYRQPAQSFAEGEEVKSPSEVTPTLSALQFHADLPHETVLNIPLSLPQLPSSESDVCGQYEDDPVPLRIHDCSLDLQIVSNPAGVVCICHHYLYKRLEGWSSSPAPEEGDVNLAYSVTLLHHGAVVHGVAPDLPWLLARSLRPSYTLYGENHLLVNIPMLFTHLLDIGLQHEPCCHVVLPAESCERAPSLTPVLGWGPHAMLDLNTLDVVTLAVSEKQLLSTFKSNTALENKLAILHYLIQHEGNGDVADELVSWMCLNQRDGFGVFQRVMQEYLVGTTYAHTKRSLPASAQSHTRLLPFTHHHDFVDVKVGDVRASVSQEKLWNTSAVLLAPRQRICQFVEDMWSRLWRHLTHDNADRFKCAQVLDKLRVSLHCYQPEALSRCTTPMSPGASAPMLMAAPTRRPSLGAQGEMLPFFEIDMCTASKQEHIIAVNLREMSMHLLRGASGRSGAEGAAVHAVGTRWAAAQLDASRALCRAVLRAVAANATTNQHRGFTFIDEMDETHACVVFKVLEQYYLAADSIGFPLPQGFTSFFTYLGYRTLPFHLFLQYVHRSIFELQIDVMKAIIVAKEDNSKASVNNKLRLIQLIGEGRARRALAAWPHKAALLLRARDHAATLLSGQGLTAAVDNTGHNRTHHAAQKKGLAAFPMGERLSPLDTFLDLLTAKASLNELDFNLIVEATLAAVHTE